MTKAARIRELIREGWPPVAVAAMVGCSADYVRAIRSRDRIGLSQDMKERASEQSKKKYYAVDREERGVIRSTIYRRRRLLGDSVKAAENAVMREIMRAGAERLRSRTESETALQVDT